MTTQASSPRWMRNVLLAAGLYNVLWGAWAVLFPSAIFNWLDMPQPNYPQFWQCIGMIVGVYGVGYAIAAFDPFRHWPIVLVGFLGKVFGPLGIVVRKVSVPCGSTQPDIACRMRLRKRRSRCY